MRFLRYPGGKGKLLTFLSNYLPQSHEIGGRYIEPFVGGGSVFLFLQPSKAIISDVNQELIDLYNGIKYHHKNVWEIFKSFPEGKEAYYKIRDEKNIELKPIFYRSARTLYLNRTCFKGMWRHNSRGSFNVGYGGEARRWVIKLENLLELSYSLKKAEILQSDFKNTLHEVDHKDFIFLDPPYKPGEQEMTHAHYLHGTFSFKDQIKLSEEIRRISKTKKIKWLMTNSSHSKICDLYKGFNIKKIPKGTSNVLGVLQENSKEVLISNY